MDRPCVWNLAFIQFPENQLTAKNSEKLISGPHTTALSPFSISYLRKRDWYNRKASSHCSHWQPCEVVTFCNYLDDTRKSDSFNQVNEVKSFGKCKWLPGMCPHRFGCISPHGGGPSSQCKIDAPIFCPEYVRFVIKFAKGAHYWSKLNWEEFQKSATWSGHVGLLEDSWHC